jgi:L-2-hydroxyglutarate oxidase
MNLSQKGIQEMIRSFYKAVFVCSLQRLIPEMQAGELIPIHAGVCTQALINDGKLVDD